MNTYIPHLYKMSYWDNGGKFYCNDVEAVGHVSSKWWVPARILQLSLTEYVNLLVEKFKVDKLRYYADKDLLTFYFNDENKADKFVKYVNKIAKEKKAYV